MSRTYAYKPDMKKRNKSRTLSDKNLKLADFEIEFIEDYLGPSIRLSL